MEAFSSLRCKSGSRVRVVSVAPYMARRETFSRSGVITVNMPFLSGSLLCCTVLMTAFSTICSVIERIRGGIFW